MFRTLLFLAIIPRVLVAQTPPANPRPGMPWVLPGECPGEGCSLGEWLVCKPLVARGEDRADAPVAFRLKRGERIEAITSNMHVEAPGIVVFRDTVTYVPEPEAPSQDTVPFGPSDTLYLLTYRGEGFWLWWLHGQAGIGQDFWQSMAAAQLVTEGRRTWWAQVRRAGGQTGWIVPEFSSSLVTRGETCLR